ncbi:MAG: choice-of-anchor I family protein, partial [Thermoleophilia bacterium]|nr:choice-of-anchor I family protein [Thermoleophilia bacterium]
APSGVEVGMLPDSVHFSPDGKTIVVANEGEPKDYCQVNGDFVAANDPKGTVSIIDVTSATLSATTIDFSAYNANAAGIRTAGGRIYGPGATVAQDLEPEYVAISTDSKTAFVTLQENNAVAEVDLATKTVTRIMGLGYKDHSVAGSGLDPSDREVSSSQGAVTIGTWPVFGMYQPDNIATFTGSDGAKYFMTSNEGDSREYPCLLGGTSTSTLEAEDGRIGANGIDGQSGADGLLGRLTVTRFAPSVSTANLTYGGETFASGTPAYTSAYSLGARSMTIWKVPAGAGIGSAVKVADTGDLIEQKTSVLYPTFFNNDGKSSNGGFNAFDSRSDNKGPEPEGIATGHAFGMQLAFVGLERQNGVMAFDVSNPASPRFLDYLNTTNYSSTSGANYATSTNAGDVSPEGILFVSASDSPTGKPALMVSYELSGTTAIYNLNGTALVPGVPTGVTAVANGRAVTVSWTRPSEDGGGAITEYHVTSKPGGYTCTADATTACKLEQMPAGREYTFTVKALNIAGSSAASAASTAVKIGTFKPAAPSAIKLRAGSSSLRVEWRRSNYNGGSKITKYVATAKPGGASCTSTGRSCVIEELTAGQKYSVKVVAENAVGTSTEVGTDRVLVGVQQGAKSIAQRSPLAVNWLVRSHSPGKVKGSIVAGDCSIADGRITATGAVGSMCQVKVTVGRAPGFAPMTRTLDLEVRAPRDYEEIFARRR